MSKSTKIDKRPAYKQGKHKPVKAPAKTAKKEK